MNKADELVIWINFLQKDILYIKVVAAQKIFHINQFCLYCNMYQCWGRKYAQLNIAFNIYVYSILLLIHVVKTC